MKWISKLAGYVRFFIKEYLWKHRGMESKSIEVYPGGVLKTYNKRYHILNRKYFRRGEEYYLRKFKSNDFVIQMKIGESSILMPYAGESIGRRMIKRWNFDELKFIQWLVYAYGTLKEKKLRHRDINPSNICYDKSLNSFELIDFSWCIEDCDLSVPVVNYRRYQPDDKAAVATLMRDTIKHMIGKICTKSTKYQFGSSIKKGWVYHEIPYDGFEDVPVHKKTGEKEYSLILNQIYDDLCDQEIKSGLEIGSSVGNQSLTFATWGLDMECYEADTSVFNVAQALDIYRRFAFSESNKIDFNNTEVTDKTVFKQEKYSFVLMMNVSMWIYKQIGLERLENLMTRISCMTKYFFYQTAHAGSGGMSRISEFKTDKDIRDHLERCGFTDIKMINVSRDHGGVRYMYFCRGGVQ